MVGTEDTRRYLKAMAARVARESMEAALQQRKVFVESASYTRGVARLFRNLDDSRIPTFEFDPISIRMSGIQRVANIPVAASGAVRYRWDEREFTFTPLDGPPEAGRRRAALNELHAGLIGFAMFRHSPDGLGPYALAEPAVLASGPAGVIQFRHGKQLAAPPRRRDTRRLAAVEFVTNNVRDTHSGRTLGGLDGIHSYSRGSELVIKASDNWRTFDWDLPIGANPIVAQHSGWLFDEDTHRMISLTDTHALGYQLLRAGMVKADVAEVLERIAVLQQFGGIPAMVTRNGAA